MSHITSGDALIEMKDLEDAAKVFEKHGFGVSVVASLVDAVNLVMAEIVPASGAKTVAFGGSSTIVASGLVDKLKGIPSLDVMDTYDTSQGLEAMLELRRDALLCDLFLCSANAVTRDGKIILLDLFGNRTAAVQYGPRKVVLLIGKNKLCDDMHAGFKRIRDIAAPANAKRLDRKTPCVKAGHCMDCNSPDRICACWTVFERCAFKGRIHLVFFDEKVGF